MGVFAKNILITTGARCLQLIVGVGTSIIAARSLGSEGRGIYALAILFPAMLVAFTEFGIGPASVYYLGKETYTPKEIFGANLMLSLLISAAAIVIGTILVIGFGDTIFPNIPHKYLLFVLLQVPFAFALNVCSYVLLGLQRLGTYNIAQLLASSLFLAVLAFFWLWGRLTVGTAIMAQTLSSMTACVIVLWQTHKISAGIRICLPRAMVRDLLSFGIRNYLSTVLSFLKYRLNFVLVNYFLNPASVGIYSIAVSSSEQTWIVADSAATVLFPRVAAEKDSRERNAFTAMVCRNVMTVVTVMVAVLECIGGWLIITMYSNEFVDSVTPFRILLFGVVAISGWRILANDIAGRGKPMVNTYITACIVVFNVVLNVLLIPLDGIRGAAIATVVTYTMAFLICALVSKRMTGNRFQDLVLLRLADIGVYRRITLQILQRIVPAYWRVRYAK